MKLALDAPDGAGEAGAELADRAEALEVDFPDGVAALGELERLGHRLHLGLVTHYGCTRRGQGSRHVVGHKPACVVEMLTSADDIPIARLH